MLARLLFIWVFLLSSAAFASGEVMYIHTDGLGSPVARSDKNGNYISGSRTRYEPYGATAAGATPTIGFAGHVNDANTGLVYMQQRYYDPYAGRFLSTDPVLTDANTGTSFNRYIYANNNPYKYIDRDGRIAETVWDVFNVGLGVASMANNLANGNYGSAALDAVGVAIDSAASAAPFIPGGVATVINTSRAASAVENVVSGASKLPGTKTVGELKLLHSKETIGNRPDLAKLSDKELLQSVTNPKNGDKVKVSSESGKVVDGNSRVAELQKRAADPKSSIQPDTKIPVQTHKPDKSMFDL